VSPRLGLPRVQAAQEHSPGIRASQTEHDRHRRRLPGSVPAEQGQHLARPQLEVDPVERSDGTERLRDAFEACFGRD
jgi:hypothetical protein